MNRGTLLGARVERGPAALEIEAPLIDAAFDDGGIRLVADREHAFLRVPVADFAISQGRHVRVDPRPDALAADVEVYLRGMVAAMLLGQRGRFALHASLVGVAETTVAIAGPSGVGKSTTALRLEQRGHELIGDEFTELQPEADGVVYATPGRAVQIDQATAAALGIDTADADSLSPRGQKLALPPRPASSGQIGAVAVLAHGESTEIGLERLVGGRALANVFRHAYRVDVAQRLWPTEAFAWAGAITSRVPVYAVKRPYFEWTVDAVADAVEAAAAEAHSADAARL